MDFEHMELVKKYVSIDNKVLNSKENEEYIRISGEIQKLDEEKREIQEKLSQHLESINCDKLAIQTSDGTIHFKKSLVMQNPTKKIIREKIEEYSRKTPGINEQELYSLIVELPRKATYTFKRDII